MTDTASKVGAHTLPLVGVDAATALRDPLIHGLLLFFRHCIHDAIQARASELRAAIPDVLPSENLRGFDPRDHWPRLATPALYVWWPERSRTRIRPWTTLKSIRERELHLMYVCARVNYPDGADVFSGLMAAADAALCLASERGYHPTFRLNNADAMGTPLARSLADPGMLSWRYTGSRHGIMAPVPRRGRGATAEQVEHVFPVLLGTIETEELVVPGNVGEVEEITESRLEMSGEGVLILDRYLDGPPPPPDP